MLVNVFNNTYLNSAAVGKLELVTNHKDGTRTNRTTIYDLTGQNILGIFESKVSPNESSADRHEAILRDNFHHHEIIRAIKEGTDARNYASNVSD